MPYSLTNSDWRNVIRLTDGINVEDDKVNISI